MKLPAAPAGFLGATLCATLLCPGLGALPAPPAVFTIREVFGVSHPRQIIDFDLHTPVDPANAWVAGPDGRSVPFQLLRGNKLAVETDLPAFAERTWNLRTGHPPPPLNSAVSSIQIKTTAAWYEITNGLTGVRITRNGLAPLQGIRYRDGIWTGTGPNDLLGLNGLRLTPKAFTIRFLEKGPLKVVLEAAWTFARPEIVFEKTRIPAGEGYYRCTIEIQADQPSILLEEDTDMEIRYQFAVSPGLDPDQARYRGHHSSSIEHGRQADGKIYGQAHERPEQEAIRDLRFDAPAPSCYTWSDPCIARMSVWDPWSVDTGWYWQLYNKAAGGAANLFGIFSGPASEAIGAAYNGVGVYTAPGRITGIRMEANRRGPDARVFPRIRFCWGIFVGVKGKDLADPMQVQNIGRQMNLHAGINLNKVYRYPVDADSASAARPLYMSAEAVQKIALSVRTDKVRADYLSNAEPTARPLLDFWRQPTERNRKAVVDATSTVAREMLDALVNGAGIYSFLFHYWHGGLQASTQAPWINAILTDPQASEAERRSVLAAAVLFAGILWDDDFVPLQEGAGLNLGTANMPVQQGEYRNLYALMLSDLPFMRGHAKSVAANAIASLHNTVNESGSHMGSTHYIGAAMGPLLSTLQQIHTAAENGFPAPDPFREEPRLAAFAEFFMNLLTPPEVRFGASRKVVCIGDGSTESSVFYGQMATGFASARPELSARLMWAWNRDGAPHDGFHGSTVLKIDDSLPAKDPELGDASFPGWYSVLRNGWRTRDETAIWFVNGDFYRDHMHEDNGNLVVYALGAPLSVDWMSFYNPSSSGAWMHNAPIPESRLKFAWNDGRTHLDPIGFRWGGAVPEAFESTPSSSYARASFHPPDDPAGTLKWTRSVYSAHPDPAHPVIVIHDKFEGAGSDAPKVLSLNLMAQGPPDASVPGRLAFTGQFLIDFDVYIFTGKPVETVVDRWGHSEAPAREQAEFRAANGRPFEENQQILRLRSTGEFVLVLLPRHKGEKRRASVVRNGSLITVSRDNADPVTVTLR